MPENINDSSFLEPKPPKLLQIAIKDILIPSNKIANHLADLLLKNHQPKVVDVLDVFNAGFGSNLLVIAENNVQIDADEYEKLLLNSAKQVSRVLFPENRLKQLMAYNMFQKEITQQSPKFKVAFSAAKIPVDQLESLLPKQPVVPTRRDVDMAIVSKDLISDIVNSISLQICYGFVTTIKNEINSTITDWIQNLESLDSDDDENVVSSILAGSLKFVVVLIEQGWNYTNQWWDNNNYSDVLCNNALQVTNSSVVSSKRKRRDVEISNRIFSIRGIIWLLVSPLFNVTWRFFFLFQFAFYFRLFW